MRRRPVETILELADYAEVSAENVLRVVHGEAVNEDIERRVHEAIDAIGAPPYPRRVEVLPAIPPGVGTDELLERLRATAAELEASLPEGVGSVVYEALRVEVRPVAQHVAELGALFERVLARVEQVYRYGLIERLVGAVASRISRDVEAGLSPTDLEPEETARALVLMTERYLLDVFGHPERRPSEEESMAVFATLEGIWVRTLYG